MSTFQVIGNVDTWEANAEMAASIIRAVRPDEFGTRYNAHRSGIATVTTDAPEHVIDAAKHALLRSKDLAVLIAFTIAYAAHGNTDEAARVAVIAAGPGSECAGHYASFRHGTRSRIRISDEYGTRTCPESSTIARGKDAWARLANWQAHVILQQIHSAIGCVRYAPCGLSRRDRIKALRIVRALAAQGHRAWVAPHESMLSGLAIVGPTLNEDLCVAAFHAA